MVVNWAGPARAGVILGKACFPPLSHSVCCSFLPLLFLRIDISDLPREEEGAVFIARQKRKTALAFPLIS